jgi:serine/threonine protein kinase
MPVNVSLRIAADLHNGLHAPHEATGEQGEPLGIVHRDVSPHNVLVGAEGVTRVIDFGVAKAAGALASLTLPSKGVKDVTSGTRTTSGLNSSARVPSLRSHGRP